MLRALGQNLADFLFPPFCVACHSTGEWWCAECRAKIQCLEGAVCPHCLSVLSAACSVPSSGCHVQGTGLCAGSLPFNQVRALGYYHDPILRAAITALKFHGTFAIRQNLESFIASRPTPQLEVGSVLVPMPLSAKRLKERGFNQAELMALAFKKAWFQDATIDDCLKRVGHRDPQSSLSHEVVERQANVKGCFAIEGQVPRHVVLVDDVITTGATAHEAARILLSAGAEDVSVLTLAIGA